MMGVLGAELGIGLRAGSVGVCSTVEIEDSVMAHRAALGAFHNLYGSPGLFFIL